MKGIKDGALIEVIKSGKWDDAAVKQQLAAFSNIEQQARYYRVKYYFDLSKVLTPEQRQQVQQDLARHLSKYFCPLFRDNGLYPVGYKFIFIFFLQHRSISHYPLHNVEVKPYVGQFGEEMDFHTDDYRIVI